MQTVPDNFLTQWQEKRAGHLTLSWIPTVTNFLFIGRRSAIHLSTDGSFNQISERLYFVLYLDDERPNTRFNPIVLKLRHLLDSADIIDDVNWVTQKEFASIY